MASSATPVQLVDPDTNLPYKVSGGTGAASDQVQGNTASGSPDAGNPVKVGGVTPSGTGALTPTAGNSERRDFLVDRYGNQRTILVTHNITPNSGTVVVAGYTVNAARGGDVPANAVPLAVLDGYWTGSAIVAAPGDANGGYYISKGGSNMATGQAAVTTSATLIAAARTGRQKITLTPTSSVVFYVGNAGVTSTTGLYVPAGGAVTLDTAAAVYAVGASAVTVSYVELF